MVLIYMFHGILRILHLFLAQSRKHNTIAADASASTAYRRFLLLKQRSLSRARFVAPTGEFKNTHRIVVEEKLEGKRLV
jgi:hypothetical protein